MKRIELNRTERGDLTDYALVGVGKIVLISEQMGREMFREEYKNVEEMMDATCFADFITEDVLANIEGYSTRFALAS